MPTRIRCIAYSATPGDLMARDSCCGGPRITEIEPGTYFGVITGIIKSRDFLTVRIASNYWVNVWRYDPLFSCCDCRAPCGMCHCLCHSSLMGVWFAQKVPDAEVSVWEYSGWKHIEF